MFAGRAAAVLLLDLTLLGCGGSDAPPTTASHTTRPLEIAQARDVGAVGAPASVTARDIGATALVGDRLLWLFGDTLFSPASVDGQNLRPCTAALAAPGLPLQTSEPLDARGAPFACLPFLADEAAFNQASREGRMRVALWPGSIVPDGRGGGLAYYLKLVVSPGFLNYAIEGVGVAHFAANTTTGTREPGLLFTTPEPTFEHAAVFGSTAYVYGLLSGNQDVGVAMVPLAQASQRSAYRYWNGSAWVGDPRATAALFGGVSGALTVSYNAYLGRYLAVSSEVLSSRVLMRVADRPEGPWGPAVVAFTGATPPAGAFDYAAREHAELAADEGRRVYVSYYHPQAGFAGELRLVEVTFR
jgi:hypothetical protein